MFKADAKADVEIDLRTACGGKKRADERAERAFQACQQAEAKLDEYCEFELALNGNLLDS